MKEASKNSANSVTYELVPNIGFAAGASVPLVNVSQIKRRLDYRVKLSQINKS